MELRLLTSWSEVRLYWRTHYNYSSYQWNREVAEENQIAMYLWKNDARDAETLSLKMEERKSNHGVRSAARSWKNARKQILP